MEKSRKKKLKSPIGEASSRTMANRSGFKAKKRFVGRKNRIEKTDRQPKNCEEMENSSPSNGNVTKDLPK